MQSRDQAAAGYIPTLKKMEELEARAAHALDSARAAADAAKASAFGSSSAAEAAAVAVGEAAARSGIDVATNTFLGHGTVCQRCFQAKHYGRLVPLTVPASVFRGYIDALARMDALTVVVVDLFDFHGSLIADVAAALATHAESEGATGGYGPGGPARDAAGTSASAGASSGAEGHVHPSSSSARPKEVLLVVNKLDLLPQDVSLPRLETWVRTQWRRAEADARARAAEAAAAVNLPPPPSHGPSTTLLAVHLVSAARHFGVRDVARDIAAHKRGRDVYVVGAPNSGKSTLINAVLAEVWGTARPAALAGAASARAGRAAAGLDAHGRAADGSIPLEPPGSGSAGGISSSGSTGGGGKPVTLFMDELPEGYRLGDTFAGDVRELARRVRARDTGEPASPAAAAAAGGDSDLAGLNASDILAMVSARKARHKKTKVEEPTAAPFGSVGDAQPAVGSSSASVTSDPGSVDDALSMTSRGNAVTLKAGGSADGSAPTVTIATGGGAGNTAAGGGAPPVPFTTSPLPGTTLGVIGAALDPHGHAYIYDTPGIVTDAFKQRMLEALAAESGPGGGVDALVPPRRKAFLTYRLRPGRCLWLGGLVRLDYAASASPDCSVLVTVCSHLPVHVARADRAQELWARHVLGQWEEPEEEERDDGDDGTDGAAVAVDEGLGSNETLLTEPHGAGGDSPLDASAQAEATPRGPTALLRPNWGPLVSTCRVRLREYAPSNATDEVMAAAKRLRERGGPWVAPSAADGAADEGEEGAVPVSVTPQAPEFVGAREDDGGAAGESSSSSGGARAPRDRYTAAGHNPSRTQARRMTRERRAVVDIVAPGLGWFAVTPIEIEGTLGWAPAVAGAALDVHTCRGVSVHVRAPLLPYEASGTRPKDWRD